MKKQRLLESGFLKTSPSSFLIRAWDRHWQSYEVHSPKREGDTFLILEPQTKHSRLRDLTLPLFSYVDHNSWTAKTSMTDTRSDRKSLHGVASNRLLRSLACEHSIHRRRSKPAAPCTLQDRGVIRRSHAPVQRQHKLQFSPRPETHQVSFISPHLSGLETGYRLG